MLSKKLSIPDLRRIVYEGLVERPAPGARHRLPADFLSLNSIEFIGNRLPEFCDGPGLVYRRLPRHWECLKWEFYTLTCTEDPRYARARGCLQGANLSTQSEIVAAVAVPIGEALKLDAGILVPFCALCMIAFEKLGVEPFREMRILDTTIDPPVGASAVPVSPPSRPRCTEDSVSVRQIEAWAAATLASFERRGPNRPSDAEYHGGLAAARVMR